MEWCARQPKAAQAQRYAALQRSGSLFPVLENFLAFVASCDLKEVRIWGNGAALTICCWPNCTAASSCACRGSSSMTVASDYSLSDGHLKEIENIFECEDSIKIHPVSFR